MSTFETGRFNPCPDGANAPTLAEERQEALAITLAIESGTHITSIPTADLGVENDPYPITH